MAPTPGFPSLLTCLACAATYVTWHQISPCHSSITSSEQLLLNESIRSRYDIGQVLGRGTMGVVFLATRRDRNEKVAIKFLLDLTHPEMHARFVREGKVLEILDHPSVVRLYEQGQVEGRPYVVTEFASGGTLRDLLTDGQPVLPQKAASLAVQCLEGLSSCHAYSIVHRDLKPDNIMLDDQGRAKLVDFGLARAEILDQSATVTGCLLGTPRYMAPEQVRGEQATAATDLYAMGVITFEMLTGRPPFAASTVYQLMDMHVRAPVPVDRLSALSLPDGLAEVVCRALAKSPADRPRTADEMAAGLRPHARLATSKIRLLRPPPTSACPGRPEGEPAPQDATGLATSRVPALAASVASGPDDGDPAQERLVLDLDTPEERFSRTMVAIVVGLGGLALVSFLRRHGHGTGATATVAAAAILLILVLYRRQSWYADCHYVLDPVEKALLYHAQILGIETTRHVASADEIVCVRVDHMQDAGAADPEHIFWVSLRLRTRESVRVSDEERVRSNKVPLRLRARAEQAAQWLDRPVEFPGAVC